MKARKQNRTSHFDTLEGRQLYSVTAHPQVIGYIQDSTATSAYVQNFDYTTVTQLDYFSIAPDANGVLPGTSAQVNGATDAPAALSTGQDWSQNGGPHFSLSRLTNLVTAAHSHGVKVNIVVGGAGLDGSLEGVIDGDAAMQQRFADSVKNFANTYHVDGVDLDWEPTSPTSSQISNYGALIHRMKTTDVGLQLSAAVAPEEVWLAPNDPSGLEREYVLTAEAVQDLDVIGIMDYDLGLPGTGSPLQKAKDNMADWGVVVTNVQQSVGATTDYKSKLMFGVPFYGNATTLSQSQLNSDQVWSLANRFNTSAATYGQIVAADTGHTISMDKTNSVAQSLTASIDGTFATDENGATAPTATFHFDSRGVIAAKTHNALTSGFGGVMIWSMGTDYQTSPGVTDSGKSLMPALTDTFVADVGHMPNPAPVTTVPPPTPQPPVPQPPTPPAPAPVGRISGNVFLDMNRNGRRDGFDSGRSGQLVFLDDNRNGRLDSNEARTTTSSNGNYAFNNVSVGQHTVRVQSSSSLFSVSTPISRTVNVQANQIVTNVDFGETLGRWFF